MPSKPSLVSRRYDRCAKRLRIKTTLHRLRHYSATGLIAGVDIRTVTGHYRRFCRLGRHHAGHPGATITEMTVADLHESATVTRGSMRSLS